MIKILGIFEKTLTRLPRTVYGENMWKPFAKATINRALG